MKMMTENGLVTIVIPCYNQAHFLGEAIESVLKQTYQNFEIIVVNDGSTDNTSQVALSFPNIRLIEQTNSGLSASRNNGLSESNGEFIVFLDSDDRLLPKALEVGSQALTNRPECAFAAGLCQRITSEGNSLPTPQPPIVESNHYQSLLSFNFIWSPASVMYRRQIFEKTAGFNIELNPTADYEIYLRIARQFPIYHHSPIISEYRQHPSSMSKNHALMLKTTLAVFEMQTEFVKGNKRLQEALRYGIKFYKDYYLEGIWSQVFHLAKKMKLTQIIKPLNILASYPIISLNLFWRMFLRKIGLTK